MDTKFNYAVSVVFGHEGIQSDDLEDKGGFTRYGITLPFLKDNCIKVDGNNIIDINDVKAITRSKAEDIYYKYFWEKYKYYNFSALQIATKIFDMAVNMGEVTAHRILQRVINNISDANLKIDGILGEKTFKAANLLEAAKLHEAINKAQARYYKDIVELNPSQNKFLNGWLARAAW